MHSTETTDGAPDNPAPFPAADDDDDDDNDISSVVLNNNTDDDGTATATTATTTATDLYPPTPTFAECMRFALPALGIYICSPLMSLIDASFIGRLSTSADLAALGPASAISDSAPAPLLFLSIATTNLIAKSHARNDTASTGRVARTALGAGTVSATLLGLGLFVLARPLSDLYCGPGQASALAGACAGYVAVRAVALPAVVVTTVAQAVCLGTKDTRTPMVAVALAGAVNLLGDLVLVRGFRRGLAGAAWATTASQFVAAGLLLRTLSDRGILRAGLPAAAAKDGGEASATTTDTNTTSTTVATVRQLLSFLPFLFVMGVKVGWHNSCSATAASLGSISAAAHTGLISVVMVCMVLGDVGSSLSQAFLPAFERTTTPNGGGDDGANASGAATAPTTTTTSYFDTEAAMPTIFQLLKCTLSISAAVMTLAAVTVGIFGGQITSDPAVVDRMRRTLPWILGTLCFHGSAVTLEGLLLSAKQFRPLSLFYSFLAMTVLGFQVATRRFGLGLAGVWGCYLWFCSSRVVAFSLFAGLLRPREWWRRRRTRTRTTSKSL